MQERYLDDEKEKEEFYLGRKIVSWIRLYEVYNLAKDKYEIKKRVICHIYNPNKGNSKLNLGQCNNGDKLTSVNQGINQAKGYIDTCVQYGW